MSLPRNMSREKLRRLIGVSQFKVPATAWIRNGQMLNVNTGELVFTNVALMDDRIAYVGTKEPLIADHTKIIDATGKTLVPGYIEPHAHTWQVYNPLSFTEFALRHGTTTILHDNLPFFLNMNQEQLTALMADLWALPVKNFWWGRVDPQVQGTLLDVLFEPDRFDWVMAHPLVLQAGELTDFRGLLDDNEALLSRVWEAKRRSLRIETHNPGASVETLNAVGAAGITACHESITGEDVVRRIRLGYYTALRQSSIRPDLNRIVTELLSVNRIAWDKMFFTTDGSSPFYLERGVIDDCIREALDAGLDPAWAYRMASHHAAVYYRIDHEVGSISAGRLADIVFLEDLRNPTPIDVMADGRLLVEGTNLIQSFGALDWRRYGVEPFQASVHDVRPSWFRLPEEWLNSDPVRFPVV